MFTIPLLHSDIGTWWGQDFSVAPIPTRRRGFCFWPLLPCCAMKVHSCRFWLLCSSLCSAWGRPHLFYCWLCCRNCGAGYAPIKSWRKTVMMNAGVLKANSRTVSSLPVTLWWQQLTNCSNSTTFWHYLCILGSPATVHFTLCLRSWKYSAKYQTTSRIVILDLWVNLQEWCLFYRGLGVFFFPL